MGVGSSANGSSANGSSSDGSLSGKDGRLFAVKQLSKKDLLKRDKVRLAREREQREPLEGQPPNGTRSGRRCAVCAECGVFVVFAAEACVCSGCVTLRCAIPVPDRRGGVPVPAHCAPLSRALMNGGVVAASL